MAPVGAAAVVGVTPVGPTGGFWKGRRVFLTGHTGFIGGWLALSLAHRGAIVTGYSLPAPTDPAFYDATALTRLVGDNEGDVRDLPRLSGAVAAAKPEIVMHLAAQPLVRRAYDDPVETFATNVMGTVNLMQAMRNLDSLRAAVIVTTDKVYDNQEWAWGYREGDRLGGREPYGTSKACSEMVIDAYRHSYFADRAHPVGIATLRAGNVIGGGDFATDRLVPDAIRAFARNAPLLLRNPKAIRPWQHVLEPASGILMLAARLVDQPEAFSGPWNFGPAEGDARSVEWIADRLAALWGAGAAWRLDQGAQPYEARLLALTSMKATTALGWRPRWSLDDALGRTVAWYKAHLAGRNDMLSFSLDQIEAHARPC